MVFFALDLAAYLANILEECEVFLDEAGFAGGLDGFEFGDYAGGCFLTPIIRLLEQSCVGTICRLGR